MSRPASHTRVPGYCFHKAHGTGYVRIDGHVHYLPGKFNSEESVAEYNRLVGLWQLNGRQMPPGPAAAPAPALAFLTPNAQSIAPVAFPKNTNQLIEAFLTECEREYPPRNGNRNSELACIESALASLSTLYGPSPANGVEPLHLENVMKHYIGRGFCRKMVIGRR
jgi:hypothetical protein